MKKRLLLMFLCLSGMNLQILLSASVCIVINFPGTYNIGNIESAPTDPDDATICVASDDVILEFEGHVISQIAGSQVPGFVGIRVANGFTNITIKNVKIRGLTGEAIHVGENCSDIIVENVEIEDCDAGGIVCAGTIGNKIKGVNINNCLVVSCTGANGNPAYGMRLVQTDNAQIENCSIIANNASTVSEGLGISLEGCESCGIFNCQLNENGGNTLGVGINVFDSKWTQLKDCQILNTIAHDGASSSKAVGVFLESCEQSLIKNCVSKHNNNVLATAYGFEACNGTGNIFDQCFAQNNVGGTEAAGFVLKNAENCSSIIRSKSRSNDGGVAGVGYGILLDTTATCDILFNQLVGNKGLTGYGLRDSQVNTTNLIAGNVAFKNTTAGFNVIRTIGIFPVVTTLVGDFSTILSVSKYMNISFTVGP